ncbi:MULTISPECIES: hypothetical protein [unclassified Serratia (in: enterobacteria)]|uniref:hypothetical protein n=1 Tax=unclassified Serratia (in: enterobacteria) TaxID=2647522 RepID=UPI00046833BE|nr:MULTISPECIES: hypothetical protein [unclassified Serratia (in: enterobacteria)]
MYMKDSIKYGDEGGKDFGCAADELTPQACYRSSTTGTKASSMATGSPTASSGGLSISKRRWNHTYYCERGIAMILFPTTNKDGANT